MRIAVGSDHAGRVLRQAVIVHLKSAGHEVIDHGTDSGESVDYPQYAKRVVDSLLQKAAPLGILICGTGLGVSIAATKMAPDTVTAALCFNAFMATRARQHNNANILCMGEQVIGVGTALTVVDAFLASAFEGGRHARRLALIPTLKQEIDQERKSP